MNGLLYLYAEPECWQFREAYPDEWLSFGCGPGSLGDYLVPDSVLGLSVVEACRIHDWYYRLWLEGETEEDRATADRIGRNNALRIIDHAYEKGSNIWLTRIRRWLVQQAYLRVRKYGAAAFFEERNAKAYYREV